MTETPAARNYSEQQAGSLTTGSHILLPGGERTAEISQVELESDDFGARHWYSPACRAAGPCASPWALR
jgi:hypothetical protein